MASHSFNPDIRTGLIGFVVMGTLLRTKFPVSLNTRHAINLLYKELDSLLMLIRLALYTYTHSTFVFTDYSYVLMPHNFPLCNL
jgi:hypothetical protein